MVVLSGLVSWFGLQNWSTLIAAYHGDVYALIFWWGRLDNQIKDETHQARICTGIYTCGVLLSHTKLTKRDGPVMVRVRNSKFSQKKTIRYHIHTSERDIEDN